jgi:glycosyltransferase involved in cell wall biosynthesis
MARNLVRQKTSNTSFDAIHFHTQVQAFGSVAVMRKVPSVVSIDITGYQIAREYGAGPYWTYTPNIQMERRVFKAARHIITFSDWARESVICDHRISPDLVTTVHPGVDIGLIRDPEVVLDKKLRLLFVGNDFDRKGGRDLIEVFRAGASGRIELSIMSNDTISFNHPDVSFHRGVKAYTPKWHDIFRNADVLVLPSYREAYGLVLQEAAAHGLALIGSNVGGIPEMIINGMNGFLINPGDQFALADAVRILSGDRDRLRNMRHASRDLATKKFDAKINFHRLFAILNSVAGG